MRRDPALLDGLHALARLLEDPGRRDRNARELGLAQARCLAARAETVLTEPARIGDLLADALRAEARRRNPVRLS